MVYLENLAFSRRAETKSLFYQNFCLPDEEYRFKGGHKEDNHGVVIELNEKMQYLNR